MLDSLTSSTRELTPTTSDVHSAASLPPVDEDDAFRTAPLASQRKRDVSAAIMLKSKQLVDSADILLHGALLLQTQSVVSQRFSHDMSHLTTLFPTALPAVPIVTAGTTATTVAAVTAAVPSTAGAIAVDATVTVSATYNGHLARTASSAGADGAAAGSTATATAPVQLPLATRSVVAVPHILTEASAATALAAAPDLASFLDGATPVAHAWPPPTVLSLRAVPRPLRPYGAHVELPVPGALADGFAVPGASSAAAAPTLTLVQRMSTKPVTAAAAAASESLNPPRFPPRPRSDVHIIRDSSGGAMTPAALPPLTAEPALAWGPRRWAAPLQALRAEQRTALLMAVAVRVVAEARAVERGTGLSGAGLDATDDAPAGEFTCSVGSGGGVVTVAFAGQEPAVSVLVKPQAVGMHSLSGATVAAANAHIKERDTDVVVSSGTIARMNDDDHENGADSSRSSGASSRPPQPTKLVLHGLASLFDADSAALTAAAASPYVCTTIGTAGPSSAATVKTVTDSLGSAVSETAARDVLLSRNTLLLLCEVLLAELTSETALLSHAALSGGVLSLAPAHQETVLADVVANGGVLPRHSDHAAAARATAAAVTAAVAATTTVTTSTARNDSTVTAGVASGGGVVGLGSGGDVPRAPGLGGLTSVRDDTAITRLTLAGRASRFAPATTPGGAVAAAHTCGGGGSGGVSVVTSTVTAPRAASAAAAAGSVQRPRSLLKLLVACVRFDRARRAVEAQCERLRSLASVRKAGVSLSLRAVEGTPYGARLRVRDGNGRVVMEIGLSGAMVAVTAYPTRDVRAKSAYTASAGEDEENEVARPVLCGLVRAIQMLEMKVLSVIEAAGV